MNYGEWSLVAGRWSLVVEPMGSESIENQSTLTPFISSDQRPATSDRSLQPRQQRVVVRRAANALDEPFHGGLRRHLLEPAAQGEHRIHLVRAEELVLAPRAARRDVDRGVDALLGETAIELDLAVARALELLEDHVVHARARFHERRGNDRERTAAMLRRDGARGSEEGLRLGHRGGVQAAAQRASGTAFHRIRCAGESRDRVEYD